MTVLLFLRLRTFNTLGYLRRRHISLNKADVTFLSRDPVLWQSTPCQCQVIERATQRWQPVVDVN